MLLTQHPLVRWIANVRDFGLEYAVRRYYGIYGGQVVDVEDSQQQARASVKVPVTGVGRVQGDNSFTPATIARRALPSSIYAGPDHGVYFPPEPGDAAWVAFDLGDASKPRLVGSYWRNKDPNRAPANSEVPSEFKTMSNPAGPPKKRGIKTGGGHGLIFSDEESLPYVAVWSGKQLGVGEDAKRKRQVTLSDAAGVKTVNGETVNEGIYAHTAEGLRVKLDDTEKTITVSGKPNGLLANAVVIEDLLGKVTVKTKTQQVVIDDVTNTMSLFSPGVISLAAVGGISQAGGASPPAPTVPPGASVETGAGAKIVNFAGAITQNALSFTQTAAATAFNAATTFVVNSPSITLGIGGFGITIIGGTVIIGNPLTARALANDFLIDFVLNHEHPTAATGPPSKPSVGPISTIVNPGNPLPPITLAQYGTQTRVT